MAVTPESIYNQFPTEVLLDISAKSGIFYEKRRPSKNLQVETLSQKAVDVGVQQLISLMKKTQLSDLKDALDEENLASNGNNPNSTQVIAKRLREAIIASGGIGAFLRENEVSVSTLQAILKCSGATATSKDAEELIALIEVETKVLGLWKFFDNFSTDELQYYAEKLDLEVASSKKADLIGCIISQTDLPSSGKKATKATKPAIDKSITLEQLNASYTATALGRWLKQRGFSDAGTKAQLAQRIIDHFKGKEIPMCKPTKTTKRALPKRHARLRPARNAVDGVKDEAAVDVSEEESDESMIDEMKKNFAESSSEEESSSDFEPNPEDYVPVKAPSEKKAPAKKAPAKAKAAPSKKKVEEKDSEEESEGAESGEASEESEEAPKKSTKKTSPKKEAAKKGPSKKGKNSKKTEDSSDIDVEVDQEAEEVEEKEEVEQEKEEVEEEGEKESEEEEDMEVEEPESVTFEGNYFCVSGAFGDVSAEDVKNLIKQKGGSVSASITSKTTYLVTAESDPAHRLVKAATNRGMPILGVEFVKSLSQ